MPFSVHNLPCLIPTRFSHVLAAHAVPVAKPCLRLAHHFEGRDKYKALSKVFFNEGAPDKRLTPPGHYHVNTNSRRLPNQ